ncbi:bifunctional isocitrate dehydrogenase kinase/phosphatase [Cecembia sp.]|uniref:bifunctional isocitrate dehydrogenase kinase/phosphatase n=1 Tax=Cecembia sp. TaxID=1898110 RepID=UPI0025BA886A|nr:bifunctional isocitrate dehydrogenase kinase/phosphatase [Cecembia sp.]
MGKPIRIVSFILFQLIFLACTSERKSEEDVWDGELDKFNEMSMLLETNIQRIPEWVAYWKEMEPAFRSESFVVERKEGYEELEWPEENPIGRESPFFPYLLPHPDGIGQVDIYSYKVFVPAQGRTGFQPDSEVIFFKENGLRERLLFVGPSGGFDEAIWVNAQLLLVAGYFEEEQGFTPKIWLIDIENQSYTIFKHPFYTTNFDRHGYLKRKLSNIDF